MLESDVVVLFLFSRTLQPPDFYALSLHDALPICRAALKAAAAGFAVPFVFRRHAAAAPSETVYHASFGASGMAGSDRKSTGLNSSHVSISYAVFCLKKKNAACRTVAPPRPSLRSS